MAKSIDQEFADKFVRKLHGEVPLAKEGKKVKDKLDESAPKRESDRKRPGKGDEKGASRTLADKLKKKN